MFADPWATPSIPLSSPLQFASGGQPTAPSVSTGNFDPQIRELLAAGVSPSTIRMLGVEGAASASRGFRGAKKGLVEGTEGVRQSAQGFLKNYGKYTPLAVGAASLVPGATTALSELEAGRPTGAVGALAPGLLTAAGTGLAMVPHPIAKGFGYGLMGLGALLPGASASGAEALKRKATGEPITGKEDFGNQLARARQINELGTTMYRDNMGVYTSGLMDLNKAISDQAHLDLQRKLPIINQLNNAALVRQQALLNTQNQGYLQQGLLATAGALAQGAQAETGATVRTALSNNPYAGSVMQAPQIRFG